MSPYLVFWKLIFNHIYKVFISFVFNFISFYFSLEVLVLFIPFATQNSEFFSARDSNSFQIYLKITPDLTIKIYG